MFVTERFELNPLFKNLLKRRKAKFGFGMLGAVTYYRTYSRMKPNGQQEKWADTVIRAIEGAMSILKTHYANNGIPFNEEHWQKEAIDMAEATFEFKMLPPGRGLFAGGTEYVYKKGSGALNNCSATTVTKLSRDASWLMNCLMLGIGVGYDTHRSNFTFHQPTENPIVYAIPDDREGWVDSLRCLIESYERGGATIKFDYSLVRPAGARINGFGGTASGPEPLAKMHEQIRGFLDAHVAGKISDTRLIADTMNVIAVAIIAGNTRRSALICLGSPHDQEFLDLKDWNKNVERNDWQTGWGHTSNNSPIFESPDDFDTIPNIAERIRMNGEPGVINLMNVQKYARIGDKRKDIASLINPCAEIPLEDKELCNLVEVFPTRCKNHEEIYESLRLATIYASCISLLETDSAETNAVIAKNRRIGVSLSGIADWFEIEPYKSNIVRVLNTGYDIVRETNKQFAKQAKVPAAVRCTTVKPSGSISLLAGVSAGMHHPIYKEHIRRIKIAENSPVTPILFNAGVPYELDDKDSKTLIFEFPISLGKVRAQDEVSLFEHGARLALLSRFWADNAVSNTITFNQKTESHLIEPFLTYTLPFTKSISMLPISDDGAIYRQAPYEKITKEEYQRRSDAIRDIDWNDYHGSDGEDSKFCTNDTCTF